jgi:SAM-dependent methyltransferase
LMGSGGLKPLGGEDRPVIMYDYYNRNLSDERLRRVYEIAPDRVRRYLRAEVDHVVGRMARGSVVLELGCGYGRILPALAGKAAAVFGIDTSWPSLLAARARIARLGKCRLACMDAACLGLADRVFDCVVCIQNGLSAFHVDPRGLVLEAVRVARSGGVVLFSTYAEGFWEHRLRWFEMQAEAGLLGEIDYGKTGNGVIVCRDGFTATTISPQDFRRLTRGLDARVDLVEVDESSLFCEITLPDA